MDPKIYRNSVLPISFISKYMSHQHMLLDGSKFRPHLGCNSRVGVSILVVLPGGLIRNDPDEYFRFIDIIHGNNTYCIGAF